MRVPGLVVVGEGVGNTERVGHIRRQCSAKPIEGLHRPAAIANHRRAEFRRREQCNFISADEEILAVDVAGGRGAEPRDKRSNGVRRSGPIPSGLSSCADPMATESFEQRLPITLQLLLEPFSASRLPRSGTRPNQIAANVEAALFTRHATGKTGESFL